MCSISSMVSEEAYWKGDFGIPVSDSASVVSTGMASECSLLALHPLRVSSPGSECFLCHVFFFSTHPPSSSLLSFPGGSKEVGP